MKQLGCALVVLVVAVGGFIAVAAFVMSRGEDQSALTKQVKLTVIDPREDSRSNLGRGYAFDYAYRHDGEWYAGEDWIRDNYWTPGTPLTACIDPDEPREHVVTIRMERCGQESIVGGLIDEATPTSAPPR